MPSTEQDPLNETMTGLLAEMRKITAQQESGGKTDITVKAKADTVKALNEEREKLSKKERKEAKAKAKDAQAEMDERFRRIMRDELHGVRAPSLKIGKADIEKEPKGRIKAGAVQRPFRPFAKAFRDYHAGELFEAMAAAKGMPLFGLDDGMGGVSLEMQLRGKARLGQLLRYADSPGFGMIAAKATLGATAATGGYVLPNNLVDSVIKPNVQEAFYSKLCTLRSGVAVRGVDQPYRSDTTTRAQMQNWGATKENRNEAYGAYTATLGTMALIYDVGKQYLRFSAGSAEEDVMNELARAHGLGENYEVIAGPGTGSSTPGVNDPCYGVYPALVAGIATFQTTGFTAANGTILGSAGKGFSLMLKALAKRARRATAIVIDAGPYWDLLGQGTDTAGFFVPAVESATTISGFQRTPDGTLMWHGVPIFSDANLDANTGVSGTAIAGQWDMLKLYRGVEFRIDTSDQSGTRWDQNLVGYRGEQEFGINAGSAVAVGAFQYLTGLVP